MQKIIPDTSVLIKGVLTKLIELGSLKDCEVIIPLAVVDELQAQASRGREIGLKGLEELKGIRELAEGKGIRVRFSGERPSLEDIKLARSGRIDALIRDVAKAEGGKLYTSDYVQALVAEAEGVPVEYIEPYEKTEEFSFQSYLRPDVLSLYLRSGSPPYGRILRDGKVETTKLGEEECDDDLLNRILDEVMAVARVKEEADITLLKPDAIILETSEHRISISKPPFSDRLEATIQRNILKLVSEQKLVEPIVRECEDGLHGILLLNTDKVYTFPIAEKIAEKLRESGMRIKIMGHTRRTCSSAPYYGPLEGDLEKTIEFILSDPPDYLIFDELRKLKDIKLIKELRSAGLGVLAFLTSTSLKLAVMKVLEVIKLPNLQEVFNKIMLVKCNGMLETYTLSSAIKTPIGLSPDFGVSLVIEIIGKGRRRYEVYDVNGLPIIVDLREVSNRLEGLEKSIRKILRKAGRTGVGIELESVRLDKITLRVSKRKIPKLVKLMRRLEEEVGVGVELLAK